MDFGALKGILEFRFLNKQGSRSKAFTFWYNAFKVLGSKI